MKLKARESLANFSAYHGGSWSGRKQSHQQDCQSGKFWPFQGVNSEFTRLRQVLLYTVPKNPPVITHPERVQHLRKLNWSELRRELRALARIFQRQGVRVEFVEADFFSDFKPNLMFLRDHFFMTPWGAVLGRMASSVRAGEEKWSQLALARCGVPLLEMIRGEGTFEGADALWLNPKLVVVGTGNRTNQPGLVQLRSLLRAFEVRVFEVPLPQSVQHLLGLLQLVDERRALVRIEIAPKPLLKLLRRMEIEIIPVPEIDEVILQQGMNVVCLSPKRVIMPADCPELKQIYQKAGLKVLAEAPISQLLAAAGGIACATGILGRTLRAP